ncbi:DEAD/DEAH box helicase [Pseudoroseomonas cervicalis]|uniref:DEAD/DEAH box helicase n=1 Tax=Teichococcus cervicalis TaxID=204525 RepID=UPI0022F1A719|nr:DEAD/DEAH box helicase [Pseudoroseomonas cervicalis]WBV44703.1 DEAD/DEAH box helicase [Pseudoroseomonas cervicalis]
MNSPPSSSELSGAYDLLHPEVRRWVRDQGWVGLREIQSRAIMEVRGGWGDVLVAASTAAGKTEAAFLPVLSEVAHEPHSGLSVLYVAPLKALINDQFGRLEDLCERLDLSLVRWHGDAPAAAKSSLVKRPRGVALITPESIEALFSRRPAAAKGLFGKLRFIVIDELHAFLAGQRGVHLASLLRRIDGMAAQPARRIGLSATLGDLNAAAAWLRPSAPLDVRVVRSPPGGSNLQLQVRGYIEPFRAQAAEGAGDLAIRAVADHLMRTLRGTNSLVFGGSRARVETVADLLRGLCERHNVPNEFFPHHGSLSKELREDLERRLKEGRLPTTAVCTSTLELGIDIGSVASVAQIGAPRSLASLRQRLGRSGRRIGVPAVLRLYVIEDELKADAGLLDQLRQETIRAVAAVRLLGQGFIEAPGSVDGLGSALLHQTLSVICERGGARADTIYRQLCGPGPFASVKPPLFMDLLRSMGSPDAKLIEQAPDGVLMLGEVGERLASSRDFFALFATGDEWRIVTSGRSLGSIPISNPVMIGNLIVFAGRRWIVREVDEPSRIITVDPHKGGTPPTFEDRTPEPVDDRLAAEMLAVYLADDQPGWIDATLMRLLDEGRKSFRRMGLETRRALRMGDDVHLFTWRGTRSNGLLAIVLGAAGFTASAHDTSVVVSRPDVHQLATKLAELHVSGIPDLAAVSADVAAISTGKFDGLIEPTVLRSFWVLGAQGAADDIAATVAPLQQIAEGEDGGSQPAAATELAEEPAVGNAGQRLPIDVEGHPDDPA